jgi:carboxypeptidase PM20D1
LWLISGCFRKYRKRCKAHIAKATEGFDVEVEEIDNTREASAVSSTNTKAYKIIEQE